MAVKSHSAPVVDKADKNVVLAAAAVVEETVRRKDGANNT